MIYSMIININIPSIRAIHLQYLNVFNCHATRDKRQIYHILTYTLLEKLRKVLALAFQYIVYIQITRFFWPVQDFFQQYSWVYIYPSFHWFFPTQLLTWSFTSQAPSRDQNQWLNLPKCVPQSRSHNLSNLSNLFYESSSHQKSSKNQHILPGSSPTL